MRLWGNKNRAVSILLILLLLLNGTVFAAADTQKQQYKSEKIELKVQEKLKKDDKVGVIVYLKDQVDTQKLVNSELSTMRNVSEYEEKQMRRKVVYNSLKNTAKNTQANILKLLSKEKLNKNVKDFRSYFLVNAIYVNANSKVIEKLSTMDEVEKIYLDKKIKIELPESTKSNVISATDGVEWNIEKVKAPQVWDLGYDGQGVTVGIIDTGVDWTNEALKEKWRGYDKATDTTNPEGNWFDAVYGKEMPYDIAEVPHGSHVTGTILGQDPAGNNKIGVAPGAKWIAAKAFTDEGGSDSWLLAAGEWMLAPGGDPTKAPDIINNSWGGGDGVDDWYRKMVRNWRAAGILPVFAAGNQKPGESSPWPGSIECPSNYPESFAVAATDINNRRGSFSKLGPSPYDDKLIKPDISAPGVNIRSSVPGGYEAGWNGTSMATPHIAGVAALLLDINSELKPSELENIIKETATPLIDYSYQEAPNFAYGYGLVNAYEAANILVNGMGTITGTVSIAGEDIEVPVITHQQEIFNTYASMSVIVEANLKDDVSIVEANLLVKNDNEKEWTKVSMDRKSGDFKDGNYFASIPEEIVQEPGFSYKISVKDFGNHEAVTQEYNVGVVFGIIPGEYETDFTEEPIGWEYIGDWEWGEPVGEPVPHKGTKLMGTKLSGNYSSQTDSILATPPIDLRNIKQGESVKFKFYQWYDTESTDKCAIYISDDYGANWNIVGTEFSGNDKQWREKIIDLGSYAGSETPVFILFEMASDWYLEYKGWYIDDVVLEKNDSQAPNPPVGLTTTLSANSIMLNWDASTEADLSGYKVYRSLKSGEGYELLGETKDNKLLDTNVEKGVNYYYVVTAIDMAGNESVYSEEVSAQLEDEGSTKVLYSSDFEADNGNVVSGGGNNTWEWGVPASGPNAALTGTKVWATNLSGNYEDNCNCWIQIPSIDVPESGSTELSFYHWYNFVLGYPMDPSDYGSVLVNIDGESLWEGDIVPFPGYYCDSSSDWVLEKLSLDKYKGKKVNIRFKLYSEEDYMYDEGWYINDISIINKPEATETVVEDMIIENESKETFKFDLSNFNKPTIEKANNTIENLPMDAVVTIVETGKSVNTDPKDGTFTIYHPANKEGESWTIRVEAPGFKTIEEKVELKDKGIVVKDFVLISQGEEPIEPLEITNISPSEDLTLKAGEKVAVSFNAPEGGKGYFKVMLPFAISATEIGTLMEEKAPGYYEGTWTAPEGIVAENLLIELVFVSKEDEVVTKMANGKITIVKPEEPADDKLSLENLPANTVIVGNEAFDIRYLNNNSEAQIKLIQWFNGKNPVFIKLNEKTIVNIKGEVVGINDLTDEITYFDGDGNITVYVK